MTDHGNASVSGYIAVMCAVGSGVILITIGIMLVYYVRARNRERRPDDAFVAYLHQHARSFSVGVPLEDVEEANAARVERRRRRMECMGSHATRAYVEIISAEVVQSPHAADAPPMLSSSSSSSPPDEDDHDRGGGPPWEINEESLEAGLSNSEFVMLFGSEPTMWSVAMGRTCHSSNQSEQRVHELDHPQHPHHQHLEGYVPHSSFSRRKKIMSHHIRLPSQEVYGHANYNTVEVRYDDG